jgi:hypothetical protein
MRSRFLGLNKKYIRTWFIINNMHSVPYTCPRCKYTTIHKNDMKRHLYNKKKDCPGSVNDIELTDEIKEKILKNRCYAVPKQNNRASNKPNKDLIATINKLQHDIEMLKEKKSEKFYQNIVELYLGGTHKKVSCGVTDVTTDTIHAEIKNSKDYKAAIGQVLCYNTVDPKAQLQLYIFGPESHKHFENAKTVCEGLNIELFTFQNINNCVHIINSNKEIVYTFMGCDY